jgi:hypothetical protein
MADRDPPLVRRIIDDLNHGDIIGGPGGGPFLPLAGGELSGPLNLPNGTVATPSLQLGASDGTGLSRSANAIVMSVQGSTIFGTFAGAAQFYGQLSMLGNRVTQVADPTAAGDALNLRTADARYVAAVGPWQDFVGEPGWNALLRYRLTPLGVQLEGGMQPTVPLNANTDTLMGALPPGYRPQRRQWLAATLVFPTPPIRYVFASVWAEATNGQLFTSWPEPSGGNAYVAVSGVLTLEP